jgi:glycosyltransferase EpsD
MTKKIIFIFNHVVFLKFNAPFMEWFKKQGWQVDYASNREEDIPFVDNKYTINIKRSPFKTENIKAYFQLKKILKNNYDIIHCHTPMGGFLGRFVVRDRRYKTNVMYTAHGLHFYKGAPLVNWLFYCPVEKYLAKFTDALILLNKEDYEFAKNNLQANHQPRPELEPAARRGMLFSRSGCTRRFNTFLTALKSNLRFGGVLCGLSPQVRPLGTNENIYKIDGVGVDLKLFFPLNDDERERLRTENGYGKDFIIVYAAEFIARKNHIYLLKQVQELVKSIPELKIILMGNGILENKMIALAKKLKISGSISFLGYRNDVNRIYQMADIVVSPSLQEGLPVNIIEGIATGLPIVCSKIRGHTDLVKNGHNGFMFGLNDPDAMKAAIKELYNNKILRKQISMNNIADAKKYSLEIAVNKMAEIYRQFM